MIEQDLNRVTAVYALSDLLQGGRGKMREGLLHDILSLLFYHGVVKNLSLENYLSSLPSAMAEDIVKTIVLMLISGLMKGSVNIKNLLLTLVGVCVYHIMVRPMLLDSKLVTMVDYETIEDIAETLIILGIGNSSMNEIGTRVLSLIIYHNLMRVKI